MGASTLIGNRVCNQRGEDLGDIKEIILDLRNGKVVYAMLSYGGFLGKGDKPFAVPWNTLTVDRKHNCLVLNTEKVNFDNAMESNKPNMTCLS
jgi:sporulation protein YlmC with PRC-barrel domain